MATTSEHMVSDMETIPAFPDRNRWQEQPARRVPLPEALASHRFQCTFAPLVSLHVFEQLMIFACIWQ